MPHFPHPSQITQGHQRRESTRLETVHSKYHLITELNSGSFGVIYLGRNVHTRQYVAVKVEPQGRKRVLEHERNVYKLLGKGKTVPRIHWYGQEKLYNVLVMDALGLNLGLLYQYCGARFSAVTRVRLALQMLACVEKVHRKAIIHRDIKPANFVMGLGKDSKRLYLIDFGLAMRACGREQVGYACAGSLVGTARYASINAHLDSGQSYRDDLEGLGYTLIFFLRGSLPWQGLVTATKKERYEKIFQMKLHTPLDELCENDATLMSFMNYCRNLHHNQLPDYAYLRQLFKAAIPDFKLHENYEFDWTIRQMRKRERNRRKAAGAQ
jgi:serine/threonine protein kinase